MEAIRSEEVKEGKNMAIVSYITVIGLLVALLANSNRQNRFVRYHIGQSVRVVLLGALNYTLGLFLPASLGILTSVIGVGVLLLAILGIVNAANGKSDPLPIIGEL